jgi:hypothetical protein
MGMIFADAEQWENARSTLGVLESMEIREPDVLVMVQYLRATIKERDGDLEGARSSFQAALREAHEHGLRSQEADLHKSLRELAQKQNDLTAYIKHNGCNSTSGATL